MSLINQLNATTEVYWANTDPVDILNKASALVWKLMNNAVERENWEVQPFETVDGGTAIKVPLEYAGSNRGNYGAKTVIDQSKKDIIDAARFFWAGVYGSNTLNLDDLTQNAGENAIVTLTKQYMQSIKKAARIQMAHEVLSASSGADSITGLGDLFNTSASTEYGSLSENQLASWKANVLTDAEAISFEVMQKIFRQPGFGDNKGMKPNFCVTTTLLRDGYERSLHPQQRYGDEKMVEAGWDNIMHKGAPIVADTYYDDSYSGYLDALNLNFINLRSHKDYNFTTPKWVTKEVVGQPDIITANSRWRGNLTCSNRQMHVRHNNLSEPA